MASGTISNAKDEGFSGKWVLDKNGDPSPNAPVGLVSKIKQDGSKVTIESTFKEPANGLVPLLYLGVMTTNLRLSLDGQPQQNQVGPFQMAAKTTVNGNQMDTEWTAEVKGDQVQGHWTHTLDSDGKHMTLEIKETSTQGQAGQATLRFVKK
ncbi:MAG TPA: hypothetical protein VGV35_08030 [Bryobacteraceae bacterium]|nr:hypothetical protein [Bryobacteraceae bacterium]